MFLGFIFPLIIYIFPLESVKILISYPDNNIYILKSNTFIMDQMGYVMSGLSLLLVLPAILLFMTFLDMTSSGVDGNSQLMESGGVLNTAKDLEGDIQAAGKQVFQYEALNVVKSGIPLSNSRKQIKNDMQIKMDDITSKYRENEKMEVECNITSVGNSVDPFAVEVNSSIKVKRDNITHHEFVTEEISIIDPQYPIANPLPFIKCRNFGDPKVINNRIEFGSSLTNYLESRGVENAFAYENSSTAYIIKKCPYDPYIMHGQHDYDTLKNCIDNGYFHESSDGSCFLCRLEGKGICPHYGMETYITPKELTNNSNNSNTSSNFTFNQAPSSIDHVIFNDTNGKIGTYQGYKLIYNSDYSNPLIIFLDNSHRQKYGFPMV